MELLIFLALAGTALAVGLGGDELATDPAEPDTPEEPETPTEPDQHLLMTGTAGTDDMLGGGDGNDTLVGNAGDRDLLSGDGGEDELYLGAGNTANGGAGADLFTLSDEGSPETLIEDFELGNDRLALAGNPDGYVELIQTEDGNGLRLIDTLYNRTIVTLQGVSLAEGETLEVDFLDGNGDHYRTVHFEDPSSSAPFALDAIRGTSDDDILAGSEGDDVIFGERGADSLFGGEGDDTLFSGSGTGFYEYSYNHLPGNLTQVGDDGDMLDGGEGDDQLWIGPGTIATGGEGADSFRAFSNVYEAGSPAAEITDFDPAEDQMQIDFPVGAGFGSAPSYSFEDAIAGLSVAYDADQDSTLIAMGGIAIATLPGDQSGISIAFHDDYSTDEDRWRDASGTEISAEDGQQASIILRAQEYFSVFGENGTGRPA
jgi:Ca2+-binding RTX toxin-like protein